MSSSVDKYTGLFLAIKRKIATLIEPDPDRILADTYLSEESKEDFYAFLEGIEFSRVPSLYVHEVLRAYWGSLSSEFICLTFLGKKQVHFVLASEDEQGALVCSMGTDSVKSIGPRIQSQNLSRLMMES